MSQACKRAQPRRSTCRCKPCGTNTFSKGWIPPGALVSASCLTKELPQPYASKAALCISADQTRSGVHTVRIEAAEAAAQRRSDWQQKIAVQLSRRELPLVLAVFMGWLDRFEGKGHGDNNSKWFIVENQSNKLFLSIHGKGQTPRGAPIQPGDGYAVTTLMLRQLLRNDPFLSPSILLSLVRREAALANGHFEPPVSA